MIKRSDVEGYFPVEVTITEELVNSDINEWDVCNCLGAQLLKSVLPERFHEYVTWGSKEGFIGEGKIALEVNTMPETSMVKIMWNKEAFREHKVTLYLKEE